MKINDFLGLLYSKKLLFVAVFGVIALIANQINFSPLLGTSNQYFTLFQFFGPIAGAFLGPLLGAASVLLAQLLDFFLTGKEFIWINIFRLTPMLLAAYYFGSRNSKLVAIVPLMCMALFVMHPIGSQVWYYSLYWLIPLAAAFFPNSLYLKSLGSTFTAHAIGSTIFLYTIPSTATLWQMLIPVVLFERAMFALGITFSFIAVNTLLSKAGHLLPSGIVTINPKYVVSKNLLRLGA